MWSRVRRDLQRNLRVPTQAKVVRLHNLRCHLAGLVKLYTALSPPLPTSCEAQELHSVDILTLTASSVDRTGQAATPHVASICCHRGHDVSQFDCSLTAERCWTAAWRLGSAEVQTSDAFRRFACTFSCIHIQMPGHNLGHNPNAAVKSLSVGKLNLVRLSCAQCAHAY